MIVDRPRITIAMIVAGVVGSVVAARAEPSAAQAQSLFSQAKELMIAEKFDEACLAFEASEHLGPGIATLVNLANCREKNGQLATAWGLFVEVDHALRTIDDESADQLRATAATHASALAPRLSTLLVTTRRRASGLVIERDGTPIEVGSLGRALPIDGGRYTIVARAPHRIAWSTTLAIASEGDHRTVEIPELAEPGVVAAPLPPGVGLCAALAAGAMAYLVVRLATHHRPRARWRSEPRLTSTSSCPGDVRRDPPSLSHGTHGLHLRAPATRSRAARALHRRDAWCTSLAPAARRSPSRSSS